MLSFFTKPGALESVAEALRRERGPDSSPWGGGTPSLALASKAAQVSSAGEDGMSYAKHSWMGTSDPGQQIGSY